VKNKKMKKKKKKKKKIKKKKEKKKKKKKKKEKEEKKKKSIPFCSSTGSLQTVTPCENFQLQCGGSLIPVRAVSGCFTKHWAPSASLRDCVTTFLLLTTGGRKKCLLILIKAAART